MLIFTDITKELPCFTIVSEVQLAEGIWAFKLIAAKSIIAKSKKSFFIFYAFFISCIVSCGESDKLKRSMSDCLIVL